MAVVSYLNDNLAEVTIITGLVFLIVEILVLGLSTIVLLTLGLSTVATGTLVWLGLLPSTFISVIGSSGIGAGILTAALWLPMKKIQHVESRQRNIHSDFVGLVLELESRLDVQHPVAMKYSGVNWTLVLEPHHRDTVVELGQIVKVVAVDVGKFTVEPIKD
ncbi:NfeD family protein [Candidatus Enterovibrio escicola]|uniref:Regulator of membrane protease YbbK n=1 Tax=Candidatus Enterovibrio escicola TaxID=1927127 RepID=A0A2A5T7J3_9GAMM|nr:activity regulator of membrane protease YbbK [Candidatus Enterovibrio escacola]PCS24145.1 regulator of membrane protease YbbK [Candidatus Enterovibrio escacola]